MSARPRKGQRFRHAIWRTEDGSAPLVCEITKISKGTIYYRPVYEDGLGMAICCELDEFSRYCGEMIQ